MSSVQRESERAGNAKGLRARCDGTDDDVDDFAQDYPYCLCDNEPTEEEEAFNVCSACGKPIYTSRE